MTNRTDAPIDEKRRRPCCCRGTPPGTLDEPDSAGGRTVPAENPEASAGTCAPSKRSARRLTVGSARGDAQPSPGSFDAILSQTRAKPRREARAGVGRGRPAPSRGALAAGWAAISGWLEALLAAVRGAAIRGTDPARRQPRAGVIGAVGEHARRTPFEVATGEAVVVFVAGADPRDVRAGRQPPGRSPRCSPRSTPHRRRAAGRGRVRAGFATARRSRAGRPCRPRPSSPFGRRGAVTP